MKASRALLSLLFLAVLHSPAAATSVRPVGLIEQVDRAELIFVGTVVGIESVPVKDGSFAFTYVTFDVQETLKGAASGRVLTLRFAGGDAGPWTYELAGSPRFAVGGKHLLFVEGNDHRLVPLVGIHQGKLDIVPDPVTQEPVLIDHTRRTVDGVRATSWSSRGTRLEERGQMRSRQPHARVISEEGVKIEILNVEGEPEEPAAASEVLEQLRGMIRGRSFSADFRRAGVVHSASPSNVPADLRFRPAPAAAAAEK